MGHKNVMSLVKLWENFEEILYQNSNSLEEIIWCLLCIGDRFVSELQQRLTNLKLSPSAMSTFPVLQSVLKHNNNWIAAQYWAKQAPT